MQLSRDLFEDPWFSRLSTAWNLIFKHGQLNRDGVVIEVAPGEVPKVGVALARYGFRGTLYVVEPEPGALKKITAHYRSLLSKATLIPLACPLEEVQSYLQEVGQLDVDALVANHPLDDMIVAEVLQNERVDQFFENCYENTAECAAQTWNHIEENLQKIQAAETQIASQWKGLIERTQPSIVGISQYRSGFYEANRIHAPDKHAYDLLCLLQKEGGETSYFLRDRLNELGLEGDRWWVRFDREASTAHSSYVSALPALPALPALNDSHEYSDYSKSQ